VFFNPCLQLTYFINFNQTNGTSKQNKTKQKTKQTDKKTPQKPKQIAGKSLEY